MIYQNHTIFYKLVKSEMKKSLGKNKIIFLFQIFLLKIICSLLNNPFHNNKKKFYMNQNSNIVIDRIIQKRKYYFL